MLRRVIIGSVLVAVVSLAVILQTTTPTSIGPLGILIVFILMYVVVLGVLTFTLAGGSRLLVRMASTLTVQRPLQPLGLRRAYYFSSALALAPVMLIGMQSVGEVGVYDVLLVALFITMACVYIAKRAQ